MWKAAFLIFFFLHATVFAGVRDFLIDKGIRFANKFEEDPTPLKDSPEKLTVDLSNPHYKNGKLTTENGGVIKNADIRIQAKNMVYTKTKEAHTIYAEGDLMVQYRGRVYVGESLDFNFRTKEGVVRNGKTFVAPFYIGGETIRILSDGNYKVETASLTTCENIDGFWDIQAQKVEVKKQEMLEVKDVRFRLFQKIPFWLPSFRLQLKKFFQPIVRYKLTWDKGAGPRASLRYEVYSWKDFALFLRGEYRLRKGFGGALETEYFPENYDASLVTKSYLASDVLPTDPEKKRRYRVQGKGHSVSPSGKTRMKISWDKYSDVLMPGDFKTDDFEINTAKKSEFYVHHREEEMLTFLKLRPRLNSFQSIKEELPTAYVTMHPYVFPYLGIISDNWTKLSYQKLSYSDDLRISLPDFRSGRLETQHEISRPFHIGAFTLTPKLGVMGTYYTNNPDEEAITFALITYGGHGETNLFRCYQKHKHIIRPYFDYIGMTRPTTNVDDHFIFSIQDGANRINQLRFGIKNLVLSLRREKNAPSFSCDLFANAFFIERKVAQLIPKLYLTWDWNLPSVAVYYWGAWNVRHNVLDFSNIRFLWTVNQNAALSIEVRYRSRYDYRKADHENFILDVTRRESEILLSPLADQRMTVLTHMFFRLSPFWTVHLRSHHGFLREGEPPYNEFRTDFYTFLTCNWRMRLTYMHTQRDDRVSVGFDLLKK